jgi:hypothetical protein
MLVNDEECSGTRSDVAAEEILLQRAIMGNDESCLSIMRNADETAAMLQQQRE